MLCPRCNGKCRVLNTRHSKDMVNSQWIPMRFKKMDEQFTWRHYSCKDCGHKIQTVEITEDVIRRLENRTRQILVDGIIAQLKGKNNEP